MDAHHFVDENVPLDGRGENKWRTGQTNKLQRNGRTDNRTDGIKERQSEGRMHR